MQRRKEWVMFKRNTNHKINIGPSTNKLSQFSQNTKIMPKSNSLYIYSICPVKVVNESAILFRLDSLIFWSAIVNTSFVVSVCVTLKQCEEMRHLQRNLVCWMYDIHCKHRLHSIQSTNHYCSNWMTTTKTLLQSNNNNSKDGWTD